MTNRYYLHEYSKKEIAEMTMFDPESVLLWWLALQGAGFTPRLSDDKTAMLMQFMVWEVSDTSPGRYQFFSADVNDWLNIWRAAYKEAHGELPLVDIRLSENSAAICANYDGKDQVIAPDLETAIARFIALNPVEKEGVK